MESSAISSRPSQPSVWRAVGDNNKNKKFSGVVLGLDFGTSNSCVAIWRPDKDRAKIIRNGSGNKITPSTLRFSDNFSSWTVGIDSTATYSVDDGFSTSSSENQNAVLRGLKSLIGRSSKDANQLQCSTLISHLLSSSSSAAGERSGEDIQIVCSDAVTKQVQSFSVEELVGKIIEYLKRCAEQYLDRRPIRKVNKIDGSPVEIDAADCSAHTIERVVLGIPSNYTEHQREILRTAASLAGFKDVHFMVESSAAAMAYGLMVAGRKNIMVVDIGGGTTDVSIMHVTGDGCYRIEANAGHRQLGGDVIDETLFHHVKRRIIEELNVVESKVVAINLLLQCRACKEQLSYEASAVIAVPREWVTDGSVSSAEEPSSASAMHLSVTVEQFNDIIRQHTLRLQATISGCIAQWKKQLPTSGGENAQIDEVVLVGGSSRVPVFREAIRAACRDEKVAFVSGEQELCTGIDAHQAVAEGLAIRGAVLQGINTNRLRDLLLLDCVPNTIGILAWDESTDVVAAADSIDKIKGQRSDRYFEPIILRGSRIFAKGSVSLSLACASQLQVSLDIYEEIEEYELSSAEDVSVRPVRISYSYHHIVSTDANIPQQGGDNSMNTKVQVEFQYLPDGVLKFEVRRCTGGRIADSDELELQRRRKDQEGSSNRMMLMLVCYAVAMLALYFIAKAAFAEEFAKTEYGSHQSDDDNSSVVNAVEKVEVSGEL